ncbi:MAG: helix-turn-helix domain-containing protein [Acidobacteria bacterium]|nr:helix-turn-helix domain-containing protein [Acidobacteriota bacterium]
MGARTRREILTLEEAAGYLRVHPQTVYRRLRAGTLPGAKVGDQWRLRKADLDEYLKGRTRESVFDEEPLSAADLREIRQGLEDIRLGRTVPRQAYRRKRSA